MRARFSRRRSTLALSLVLAAVATPLACSSSGDENTATTPSTGGAGGTVGQGGAGGQATGGSGGAGGASTGGAGGSATGGTGGVDPGPQPKAGEVCPVLNSPSFVTLSYSPQQVWVAPGKARSVTLTASPDFCARVPVSLIIADAGTATLSNVGGAFPSTTDGGSQVGTLDFAHPTITFDVKGLVTGTTKLTATMAVAGGTVTMDLPIDVRPATVAACSGSTSGMVVPGGKIGGSADLRGATLGLQAGADTPATTSEDGVTYASPILWAVDAFAATVGCSPDIVPSGFAAVGAAVTFGPASTVFPREVPMTIPIEPSAFPDKGRLRHLRVAYSGPGFVAPRTIPVANPHVVPDGNGGWMLSFLAPRLGTYQAVMKPDAGTKTFKRKLSHKAVVGVSMGGGGSAIFGLRHHDKFDVLAPLGGPVDWTWMLDHIESNHIAGFATNDGVNVPPGDGQLPLPKPKNTYEHPSSFNQWWYEYPRAGNGGTFARSDYTQIFRDLALMYGNPNSQNDDPGAFNLPRGVPLMDKSVQGDHTGDQCHVFVDPIDGSPTYDMQKENADHCPAERCAHPLSLSKYYDDEFNPKGKWPVITVCDGADQDKSKSPWSNTWAPPTNPVPLEFGLAVDYNMNGVRDLNEPILRQGHEKWRDFGDDGVDSAHEKGFMAGVNDDPAGDDYQAQYNPSGTEGDARHQDGEAFDDFGLDGVPNTASSPYDLGEGDKKFTVAKGLQNFWDHDSRSTLHQWSTPPGGPIDDAALKRLDVWTDGGTRDLFNFDVAAQHLIGSLASRDRDTAYYTGFGQLPGQTVGQDYNSQLMQWDDLQGGVLLRYGPVDATKADLDSGAGQHVGTANDLLQRLQSAFYFIGQRWPDASRAKVEDSKNDPVDGVDHCQIMGNCNFDFTDSRGRTGPVTISLPPGYAHKSQVNQRYPVMFVLHGYGQNPSDLGAAVVLLSNWMNTGFDSTATRFPKAIAVYVDGRCRIGPNGVPECIRGSFYTDSPDPTRGQFESWFLELSDQVDKQFRTMGESEIDWTE